MDRWEFERLIQTRGPRILGIAIVVLSAALVGGAAWWWVDVRIQPPPSIFDDEVGDIAGFFASDDFNALSVDERMELIAQFIQRFQGLTQSESAVLSSFFAGLTGKSREQLRDNVRILARDIMKEGAAEYFTIPPDERAAFLDQWLIKWVKFGERIDDGEERAVSDETRLAEMRRDAERDEARQQQDLGERQFVERDAVRFLDMWRREVEGVATPREQGQIMRFMTDLRQHLTR
jgi:hypothetical protein